MQFRYIIDDIIAIDGFCGGTGAAPTRIRDRVGIPIELALDTTDKRLRDGGKGVRDMRYVIIGNSAAGIDAVEGIRQVDKNRETTIITSEPHHTCSRPLLSYLLLGKITEEKMKYRGDGFYADNNCALMRDATATEIDAETKQVTLADGGRVPYDKLLVAAGSSALVPPFDELDTSLVRERTPLDRIDFALIYEKPGLMSFTKEDRLLN